MEHYGQTFPPDYHLERIVVPVAIYYSKGDILVEHNVSFDVISVSNTFKQGWFSIFLRGAGNGKYYFQMNVLVNDK